MKEALDLNKQYSYADYFKWIDDCRIEIIDGFVKMTNSHRSFQQESLANLCYLLMDNIKKRNINYKVYPNLEVRLPLNGEQKREDINNVVCPDITIISDESKMDDFGYSGAPDMIIEIQTGRHEFADKFELYEKAGVKEYWVVIADGGIEAFLLQDTGKYKEEDTLYEFEDTESKIPVVTLGDCLLYMQDIFTYLKY
jgi:Uma2 family endonuclease